MANQLYATANLAAFSLAAGNDPQNPPAGYAGVIGPAPGEPTVTSLHDAPQRQYYGGWLSAGYQGGIHYAAYNESTTGGQYYELPLFARVPTSITVEYIKDGGADGGTGDATVNGETAGFDALGPAGETGTVSFTVPAGEHLLRVRKLLRQSLYVRSVLLSAV